MEIKVIKFKQKLAVIRGLPSAGKTTWLRHNSDRHDIDRWHSADDYFTNEKGGYFFERGLLPNAHAQCQALVRSDLRDGFKGIGVHNTFSCRWEMQPYIEMAEEFNAELVVVNLFDAGLTDRELWKRNTHNVPLKTITQMRARWERDWEKGNPIAPWERKNASVSDFPWAKDD